MGNELEFKAANRIGPRLGHVTDINVTDTSARTQLSAVLTENVDAGDFFTFKAVGSGVYFGLNSSDAGTVDDTTPADAARGYYLGNGEESDFRLPRDSTGLCEWVVAKCASGGTAVLMIFRSSRTEDSV